MILKINKSIAIYPNIGADLSQNLIGGRLTVTNDIVIIKNVTIASPTFC